MNLPLALRISSDLLTIILLHGVYFLIKYCGSHKWSFFCDDWSIKYPYKDNTITDVVVTVVSYLTPLVTVNCVHEKIICFEKIFLVEIITAVLKKCTENKNYSIKGSLPFIYDFCVAALISLGTTFFLTTITKYNLGRLRPHFWDICQPNVPVNCTGLQTTYTCQGTNSKLIADLFLSFMSGHASTASASLFFTVINTYNLDAKIYVNPTPNLLLLLQIYLQARLHLPVIPFLRPFLQYVLLSVLFYICATRVTDHYHHPTDVLAGAILGLLTSVFAFILQIQHNSNAYILHINVYVAVPTDLLLTKSHSLLLEILEEKLKYRPVVIPQDKLY
ncbi:phosphatidate phosphatase [Schistosoma bovis]|uniref:Phosphatidate phosphatase n=1 Tax=Schistosoma bovis TaxID=6184 RepID=A0A430QH62_SCHBO|nr:phosphatidate phosphatase [Schistosoma bovis]